MWIERLYVVSVFVCATTGCVLGAVAWFLWRHRVYDAWDWVWEMEDRVFYGVLDVVLGKHETIIKQVKP